MENRRQVRKTFNFYCLHLLPLHVIGYYFGHSLTADGNMKLVHLKMKRPEDDVSLSDGELFMVRRAPYAEHLAHAPPRQPVSSHRNTVNV